MEEFKKLFNNSKALNVDRDDDIEPLQLDYEQLNRALGARNQQDQEMATKGQALLAAEGFDAPGLGQELDRIVLEASFEPQERLLQTDIGSYTNHWHEMIICDAIDTNRRLTDEQFNQTLSAHLSKEWEAAKGKIRSEYRMKYTEAPDAMASTSVVDPSFDVPGTPAGAAFGSMSATPMGSSFGAMTPMGTPMGFLSEFPWKIL